MTPESRRPLIFDIHRYALDDGPGIRTTVFFKGCPLACVWCHNPEGRHPEPELYCHAQRCIACADCTSICPQDALTMQATVEIDRRRCNVCSLCAAQCPAKALTIKGRYYSEAALVQELLIDRRFFENSGGGITFSGGEPTAHPHYLGRVLQALKRQGMHIALQTCGHFDWDLFAEQLLPWIDMIYFDLKGIDARRHHQWTGQSNQRILDNFARLVGVAKHKLSCTMPLITGFTAESRNLHDVANHIGAIADLPYRLHPYHPGARHKAAALGTAVASELSPCAMPTEEYQRIAVAFDSIVAHLRQKG